MGHNPFSTGGGGVSYERRVAAIYMIALLKGEVLYGISGTPHTIRFQGRHAGFLLDDLVISTRDHSGDRSLQLQIKHRLTFSDRNKLFREVIAASWKAFAAASGRLFNVGRDVLGIAVAKSSSEALVYVPQLLECARTSISGKDFVGKISTKNAWHENHRKYLSAFRSAATAAAQRVLSDDELWSFLRHLVVLHIEVDSNSAEVVAAYNGLLELVPDRNPQVATTVFKLLILKADEYAPLAGTLDATALRVYLMESLPQLFERSGISEGLAETIYRNQALFVPPAEYDKAASTLRSTNLVILCGPPHIGKTSTALHLAFSLVSSGTRSGVSLIGPTELLPEQADASEVLVCDDYFGASGLDTNRSDSFAKLVRLSQRASVIVTARAEILNDAMRSTRFADHGTNAQYCVEMSPEQSYDIGQRVLVLRKHVQFLVSDAIPIDRRLTTSTADLIGRSEYAIVSQLFFPHNIGYLCSELLKNVKSDADLSAAIANSKSIELAVRRWADGLERHERWFVFLIALFPRLPRLLLAAIYAQAAGVLGFTADDMGRLFDVCSAYVSNASQPQLRHPSYATAILELLHEKYADSVSKVVDQALLTILKADPMSFGRCADADYGWPRLDPSGSFDLVEYLRALTDAYNVFRDGPLQQVKERIAPYLKCSAGALFLLSPDDRGGCLLLVPSESEQRIYIEKPDNVKTRLDAVLNATREARRPQASESVQVGDLAVRSPQMHAVGMIRRDVLLLFQKQRLLEPWQVTNGRVERALREIGWGIMRLDTDVNTKIDLAGFQLLWAQFQAMASAGAPQGLLPFAWANSMQHLNRNLWWLERGLRILELREKAYQGPLMPQRDVSRFGRGADAYSAEQAKALILCGLKEFADCIRWMMENNFSDLCRYSQLYRHLPLFPSNVVGVVRYGDGFDANFSRLFLVRPEFRTRDGREGRIIIYPSAESNFGPERELPAEAADLLDDVEQSDCVLLTCSFGLDDFARPEKFTKNLYRWLETEVSGILEWKRIGEARDHHLLSAIARQFPPEVALSQAINLTYAVDPWEESDWPQ